MAALIYFFTLFLFLNTITTWVTDYEPLKTSLYAEWITCDRNKTTDLKVDDAQVFFYDFKNNFNYTNTISYAAETINTLYHLDVTRRVIVFIPGYKSHINRNAPEVIKTAFKDVPNIYLIVIDHSIYTSSKGGRLKSYERSVSYAHPIGEMVGQFLAKLKNIGFASKNFHCIGHSTGSQILGYAGSKYFNLTEEKVWRITGIDPAGTCFSNSLMNEKLRSGVAQYVEVYHCYAGGLITNRVLADTDFFINDGRVHPRCDGSFHSSDDSDAKCSHGSCVKYWAETVQHPKWYLAWKCDSYKLFSEGKCAGNEVTIAGYSNPGNATGVFYLSTESYEVQNGSKKL